MLYLPARVYDYASATRLVSYGPDEVDEADDDDDSGESLPSVFNLQNIPGVSCAMWTAVDCVITLCAS